MATADYVFMFWSIFTSLLFLSPFIVLCCRESAQQRAAAAERRAALARLRLAALAPVQLLSPVVPAAPVAKKLGYFPYSAEGRRESENLVCAICLEMFEHGAECSEVPACRHLFHRHCIDMWMKTKATCPLCRVDIVAGSERLSPADDMV